MGTKEGKAENNYYISVWDLSVMPAVLDDVVEPMTVVHCDYLYCVVTNIYEPNCPNKSKEIKGKTICDILHMFWLDFKGFQHKTGPFDK